MNTTTPHEPGEKPRKTKACGAKTRGKNPDGSAKRCKKSGTGKGGRCDRHGGKSLAGAESGTFKHGRRSKYLVGAALERFTDAMADRRLMQIKQDVALVEVLITGLTAKLPAKGLQTEDLERRILHAVDRRRLLVAEEARRLVQLQQTVTLAQFMATMKAVAEVIREFVTDDKQRRAAQARLTQLLLTERVGTVEDEGGDDGRTGTA
jgi:hypothetical protein